MKVLITGAHGFVGRNLSLYLTERNIEVLSYDISNNESELRAFLKAADFVVHLAGANRPKTTEEFLTVNKGLTETIIEIIKEEKLTAPIIFASTIQAVLDNEYGKSKKAAEDVLLEYRDETGNDVYVFRLHNLFGKWSRPNYNSVVATFCHNIANDKDIVVNDESAHFEFVYIDDVVRAFYEIITSASKSKQNYYFVAPTYPITIGELAVIIKSFKTSRENKVLPNVNNDFVKKLYSTYLTYLPGDKLKYSLLMHKDERGSFSEFIKGREFGQVSVNVIAPGFTKGNHYHHTKIEKFLVVQGEATINFRHVVTNETITLNVSGADLEVVDIPPGYTHNIVNNSNSDVIFIIWANEMYDPDVPDTIYEKV